MLEQALAETQSRWIRSQKVIKNIETSLEQVWHKCKAVAEPVLGSVEAPPTSYLEVELENLCTRLAIEANKWKTKCSRDSIQKTTLVLADSFQDFRTADSKLQEVEPTMSAHKTVLDNWPLYCAQTHEKEQTA